MHCPRCQHENPPQARFCEKCAAPFTEASPTTQSYTDLTSEVEGLRRALTEAVEQQKAATELLQTRNRELAEAQEQQAATSEILRVIASSPTDLQPVLDAIAESAARLCRTYDASVLRLEGAVLRVVAHHGPLPPGDALPAIRGMVTGRAVLDRQVVHVADLQAEREEFPEGSIFARTFGFRSLLSVPMLREGVAIGTIAIRRTEVQPFTDEQVALLKTFAAQAVIAIENVRLFNETKEALEQQTATSEILRVISSSPTDLQPVFDTILAHATRLCEAQLGFLHLYDGDALRLTAHRGGATAAFVEFLNRGPIRAGPGTGIGRAVRERRAIQIADMVADAAYHERDPSRVASVELEGARSAAFVPMLKEGEVIGLIVIHRREVRPFSEKHIELVTTFANQAVIAIENVRLFQELELRNRDLTEALERETATGGILRAIATSPTDPGQVFEAILESALRLCGATIGSVLLSDGQLVSVAAIRGPAGLLEAVKFAFPRRLTDSGLVPRAIREGVTVHAADVLEDPSSLREVDQVSGLRAELYAPMFREGRCIGAISVARDTPGLFSEAQVALVHTLADQAAIAIENVRLFNETKEALEQQTATAEILQVIASSPTDLQPVMDAVAENAGRVCEATASSIFRLENERLCLVARHGALRRALAIGDSFPVTRDTVSGRGVSDRRTIHVEDIMAAEAEFPVTVSTNTRAGSLSRTMLATPLLREGTPLGAILIARGPEPHPFSAKQIALLETFANQAVIAIENVRLFKELEARTADLTRSVAQLTALGEVGRAVSSTLDLETVLTTIVARAVELSRLDGGVVFEYDEGVQEFVQRASTETGDALAEARRATRIPKGEGVLGRTALTLEPVQVPDITVTGAYESRLRENLIDSGIRAMLAVPMVSEGRLIGCLGVTRNDPGTFPPETIDLLRTFATQSALAIQNARLYRAVEQKSRELQAASRHKSEFLANMSHELRTPLNAILGFSEVLAERMFGEVNAKQAEYLEDILSSGRHLLSLINDILDLAKVEAGRLELELGRFHLPTALDNALTLVRERATRHGITLAPSVDERMGDIVADERKVKQILLNLLSNAVKFTPEGGRVGLTATAASGVVTIAVSDTGVGIAPEDQAAIFEEFRQVGRDDTRKQEGTGLGLTLAKKFVELHGGRIWVESQVGPGVDVQLHAVHWA